MDEDASAFHLLLPCSLSLLLAVSIVLASHILGARVHRLPANQLLLHSGLEVVELLAAGEKPAAVLPTGRPADFLAARNLPADLAELPNLEKSMVFISLLVPHLLQANQVIREERRRLEELWERKQEFRRLTFREKRWLKRLGSRYDLKRMNLAELRLRVDEIPISLALAQAILESGWGTSRFAVQGNALFGLHHPHASLQGYMLNTTGTIKVATYASLAESVDSYFSMLNRASAYRTFRLVRARIRMQGRQPAGSELATTLGLYSELGALYTERVQTIIDRYQLGQLDALAATPQLSSIPVKFSRLPRLTASGLESR